MQREITSRGETAAAVFRQRSTGSLTTAKKKRRGVTSCKRTNSVAVKSSFLVNNERDLENKITGDIKLKRSRVTRKIGSERERDITNNNSKNIPSATLSRDKPHNTDGLLESGHLSSYNFSGYLSRHTCKKKKRASIIFVWADIRRTA